MKYYAHLFTWGGDEDVVEIDKRDINDIVINQCKIYIRNRNRNVGIRIIDIRINNTCNFLF